MVFDLNSASISCMQFYVINALLVIGDPRELNKMKRLLALQAQLVSEDEFARSRASSTIDKLELNKIVYGNNYEERLKAFEIIRANPDRFEHYHLTEADRSYQREKTTKEVQRLSDVLDIQKYTRVNPNKLTLFGNGFTFYDLNFTTKIGVHYSLYLKTIERLGS